MKEANSFYTFVCRSSTYIKLNFFIEDICIFHFFSYPFVPPVVRFLTKIIHPNVSRHGEIGLDILKHMYCTSLTLSKILLSIQSFLCDPFTKVTRDDLACDLVIYRKFEPILYSLQRYVWNRNLVFCTTMIENVLMHWLVTGPESMQWLK